MDRYKQRNFVRKTFKPEPAMRDPSSSYGYEDFLASFELPSIKMNSKIDLSDLLNSKAPKQKEYLYDQSSLVDTYHTANKNKNRVVDLIYLINEKTEYKKRGTLSKSQLQPKAQLQMTQTDSYHPYLNRESAKPSNVTPATRSYRYKPTKVYPTFILQAGKLHSTLDFVKKSPFKPAYVLHSTATSQGQLDVIADDSDEQEATLESNALLIQRLQEQIAKFEYYILVAKKAPLAKGTEIAAAISSLQRTTLERHNSSHSLISKKTSQSNFSVSLMKKPERLQWQARLTKLYAQLDANHNAEVTQTQDRLRLLCSDLQELKYQNQIEHDHLYGMPLGRYQTADKLVQSHEQILRQRIKKEQLRKDELSYWLVTSDLVEMRLKVRALENVVEAAYKVQRNKNNYELVKELERDTQVMQQTFYDLGTFLRDKYSVRTVTKPIAKWRQFQWFRVQNTVQEYRRAANDERYRLQQMYRVLAKLELERDSAEIIHTMATSFVSWSYNGGAAWQYVQNLKALRNKQSLEINSFDPKVPRTIKKSPVYIQISDVDLPLTQALYLGPSVSMQDTDLTPKIKYSNAPSPKQSQAQRVALPTISPTAKSESKWERLVRKDLAPEESRMERLQRLFELSDEEDGCLDYMAASINLDAFLKKIDKHLAYEKLIIDKHK